MSREAFIEKHPLERELRDRGVNLVGQGRRPVAKCPFHEDKAPSFSVDLDKGVWHCHAGCGGGSVIDLIAKFDGKSPIDVLKEFDSGNPEPKTFKKFQPPKPPAEDKAPPIKPEIEKIYSYQNAFAEEVFQAIRMKPKTFRQRHRDASGCWVWNMDGVERMLYRLPQVLESQTVAICEGEKDAETLVALGFCGTCNVGGAGKWLDGYTASLAGKDVLIFGDNDKAGKEHVKLVFESIAGKARWVKIIPIPSTFKDITEYVESFTEPKEAIAVIQGLVEEAHPFVKGIAMPLFTMAELEPRYKKFACNTEAESVDLSKWLPSFRGQVRNLLPGEVVLIIGDTGTGKTGLLQSIAMSALPLPTLMFEMELPAELLFERFVSAHTGIDGASIEAGYRANDCIGTEALNHHFKNLFICTESNLTASKLEAMILHSELKIGQRPKLVLLDYVQLLQGDGGSRYENASSSAEAIKRIAKATGTVIIMASQRGRPKADEYEVGLHDAKDSGSLENSAGVVIGAWRDPEDKTLLHLKILKNTKGSGGFSIQCNFNGAKMKITERAR